MAPKKKYIVSAQLFSLRDYLKTPKDMKRTFTRLRKIGYEAAQISGVGEIAPPEICIAHSESTRRRRDPRPSHCFAAC